MDYIVSGKAPDVANAMVPMVVSGGVAVPWPQANGIPQVTLTEPVGSITWGAVQTSAQTGASKTLISANAARKGIIIWSPSGNAAAAIDLSGTALASVTAGIPVFAGGAPLVLTGADCPTSAITSWGTNAQNIYYSEGT